MIWLVGGQGLLGREVRQVLEWRRLPHVSTDRELDIADAGAVQRQAVAVRPDWIINCAAYTAVDRAEAEEPLAASVNATGPKNLADAAEQTGSALLHVSTDYVFDGSQPSAYHEEAAICPINAYGRTKAEGERYVRSGCSRHVIMRTSWLHGPLGASFVATMLRLMREREEVAVVDDQRGRPTYATDLGAAILDLILRPDPSFGTFHYANRGACSWFEFATEIQERASARGLPVLGARLRAIASSQYPVAAPRPQNSELDTRRVEALLHAAIPTWEDGLQRHLDRLSGARS